MMMGDCGHTKNVRINCDWSATNRTPLNRIVLCIFNFQYFRVALAGTETSAKPSDALPSYDDDGDVIASNERKRAQRGRRHIYTDNYVSDDQNNGKWIGNGLCFYPWLITCIVTLRLSLAITSAFSLIFHLFFVAERILFLFGFLHVAH